MESAVHLEIEVESADDLCPRRLIDGDERRRRMTLSFAGMRPWWRERRQEPGMNNFGGEN